MSDFRPCRDCKDWNNCLLTSSEKEWFGYNDIRFCNVQIFWLLRYEDIIRGRNWPMPDDSAPGGVTTKALPEAGFVKVSTILAEINYRLDKTGWKGKLLREEVKNREKIMYLSDDARDALYYVSGFKRKGTPFRVWRAKKKYQNVTTPEFSHS